MPFDLFSVDDHIIEHATGVDRSAAGQVPRHVPVGHRGGRPGDWVWEGYKSPQMGLNAVAGKPQEEVDARAQPGSAT